MAEAVRIASGRGRGNSTFAPRAPGSSRKQLPAVQRAVHIHVIHV